MIDERIAVDLPAPWSQGKFETDVVGPINYLVGPNGSGKSRFAVELLRQLKSRPRGARLLGTDRLSEMANPGRWETIGATTSVWDMPRVPSSNFAKRVRKARGLILSCCSKIEWTFEFG